MQSSLHFLGKPVLSLLFRHAGGVAFSLLFGLIHFKQQTTNLPTWFPACAGTSEHPKEPNDCDVAPYFAPLLYLTVHLHAKQRSTSCLHARMAPVTT